MATLYCYVNKEVQLLSYCRVTTYISIISITIIGQTISKSLHFQVHTLIRATYRKTESAVVSRIRGESTYPRMSMGPNSERRITYSTGLHLSPSEESKDQYATIRPKLHVAEIISIQASERLAEILEPVYETIQNGVTNEGYDSLDRSDIDNDSGFIPNREFKVEDYYGFTNASSISIDCQDWIRCVSSPSSSVYNNSLNDYESKYLEKKFPNHSKLRDICEAQQFPHPDLSRSDKSGCGNCFAHINAQVANDTIKKDIDPEKEPVTVNPNDESEYDDCENMLDEIMQYIETTDNNKVILDPSCLTPNRREGEKIIFLDD